MLASRGCLCTSPRRYWRSSVLAAAVAAMLPLLGSVAWAQSDEADPPAALRLLKIIPINGTAANPTNKLFSFDISWVDPTPLTGHPAGLYYLADRSNAALDVVDITTETLFGQIGGSGMGQANFQGDTGNTATSGPDGVVALFPCIFAGDGNSRLLSFNGSVSFTTVVSAANTGGQFRVDEMAVDPKDGLVIAANNADTPPFSTIYTFNKSTCVLSNPIKTLFNALPGGHAATNGIEQPVWEPMTQRFYVSLPEIDGPGNGTGPLGQGAVARITTGGVVETLYAINFCSPAGLTVGPNGDLLAGCNTIYDLAGKKCTNVVPAPSPTTGTTAQKTPAAPLTCPTTSIPAYPQSAICNPGRGCSPAMGSLLSVPGAGGGDEVWFNSGDGNYYVTAGNNPLGPSLAVIASGVNTPANTLTQLIPTLPPVPLVPGPTPPLFTPVQSSGTVHSVAASAQNNHVYVPLPSNTAYTDPTDNTKNCVQGCIAVFGVK
jgi:hypothetical protein